MSYSGGVKKSFSFNLFLDLSFPLFICYWRTSAAAIYVSITIIWCSNKVIVCNYDSIIITNTNTNSFPLDIWTPDAMKPWLSEHPRNGSWMFQTYFFQNFSFHMSDLLPQNIVTCTFLFLFFTFWGWNANVNPLKSSLLQWNEKGK